MRILLVEDHPIFRFGVRHLLLQRWPNAEVQECSKLEDALEWVRESIPEIAIVDLNLPDAHGVESISQLHRAVPQLRLLVLSLHNEVAYATQVLKMGAMGYLNKENATDELVFAVERITNGKRYLSEALAEHMAQLIVDDSQKLPHELLGQQEYRVMLLIAQGSKMIDIAETMNLSPKTVSTYRARIFEKMGFSNNIELAQYCAEQHLTGNSL